MNHLGLIIAVLPVFLICLYVYNKDKEKEPIHYLFLLLFAGFLSAITVIITSGIFILFGYSTNVNDLSIIEIIIYSFLHVAFIEEGSKLLFLYIFSYKSKYYDYTFDMIVYGTFVSLGFALFENLLYVYKAGIQIGIQRAVTAIVLHASCGIIMGLILGNAKIRDINNKKSKYLFYFLAFLIPVCIHGMYDYCAFTNSLYRLILVVISILATSIIFINYKSSVDKKINDIVISESS